ncbi:MAG: DUF2141 domain-containing protein [Pacificimonas sp.]
MTTVKTVSMALIGALTLVAAPTAAAGSAPTNLPKVKISHDPSLCVGGAKQPAALVRVSGLKDRKGQVRIQLYPDRPDEFLESGKWITRLDAPVTPSGYMDLCVKLPYAGEMAMVVMHDREGDGKLNPLKDGAGLPGNPKMKLAKPDYEMASFVAKPGVTPMSVRLNYRRGLLGFGPVSN